METEKERLYKSVMNNRLKDLQFELSIKIGDKLPKYGIRDLNEVDILHKARLDFAKLLTEELNRVLSDINL